MVTEKHTDIEKQEDGGNLHIWKKWTHWKDHFKEKV